MLVFSSMIRKAQASDLPAILAFKTFAGDRSAEVADGRLFVCVEGDCINGWATLSAHGLLGRPYVEFLATHPEHRRHGVATRLLEHLELLHAGRRLFISTEDHNAPMLSLLNKRGYSPAGKIAGANQDGADELYFYKDIARQGGQPAEQDK